MERKILAIVEIASLACRKRAPPGFFSADKSLWPA
jgi:hypothetical protein